MSDYVDLGPLTAGERSDQIKAIMGTLSLENIEALLEAYNGVATEAEQEGNTDMVSTTATVIACMVLTHNILTGIKKDELVIAKKERV